MNVQPVTLEGRYVRLEPLALAHLDALCAIGLDENIWRWYVAPVRTREEMQAWIETALKQQVTGLCLPFVTIERTSGKVAGSTRYVNVDKIHRHVEIGSTWIGQPWQRTAVNTEAKYLMLRHAFETLGCVRVEFKTDSLNERSRRAILRIGAKEEGILRNHMITCTGRLRHSVYYSIIDSEWPQVEARLRHLVHSP